MYDQDHKPEIYASCVHCSVTELYIFSVVHVFDRNVSSLMNCRKNSREQNNMKRKYQTFKQTAFS